MERISIRLVWAETARTQAGKGKQGYITKANVGLRFGSPPRRDKHGDTLSDRLAAAVKKVLIESGGLTSYDNTTVLGSKPA